MNPNLKPFVDARYQTDALGVIHEAPPFTPPAYDLDYVKVRYNSLGVRGPAMSMLRLGWIARTVRFSGKHRPAVLDVGYGNGDFLQHCLLAGMRPYGHDVSHYPLPAGCLPARLNEPAHLVTFYDSLEHMENLDEVLRALHCAYVVISVPWCHWTSEDPAFWDWKHRRPGEHLHHFDQRPLERTFGLYGFGLVDFGHPEDAIRGEFNGRENILTATFRKL